MAYKVLVKDGQGFEVANDRLARASAAMKNGVESNRVAVFKVADDFYFCAIADRPYFVDLIERGTGTTSQACIFQKDGSIRVF
jgi:hypothetical protein